MSTLIAGIVQLAFLLAGLYCVLRYLFPRTGETAVVSLILAFLGLAIGTQWPLTSLVAVFLCAVFSKQAAGFLTSCGVTRESVETIAKGIIRRK